MSFDRMHFENLKSGLSVAYRRYTRHSNEYGWNKTYDPVVHKCFVENADLFVLYDSAGRIKDILVDRVGYASMLARDGLLPAGVEAPEVTAFREVLIHPETARIAAILRHERGEPTPDLIAMRRALRESLHGGGWWDDPLGAKK
jgi:hypothetical protein